MDSLERGYRFIGPITRVPSGVPASSSEGTGDDARANIGQAIARPWVLTLATIVVIAALARQALNEAGVLGRILKHSPQPVHGGIQTVLIIDEST
jgi:hypothetical protein